MWVTCKHPNVAVFDSRSNSTLDDDVKTLSYTWISDLLCLVCPTLPQHYKLIVPMVICLYFFNLIDLAIALNKPLKCFKYLQNLNNKSYSDINIYVVISKFLMHAQ